MAMPVKVWDLLLAKPCQGAVKYCSGCGQEKTLEHFALRGRKTRLQFNDKVVATRASRCRPCHSQECKEWVTKGDNRQRMNEAQRLWRHSSQYGLEPGDFEMMLSLQDGRCAICNRPPTGRWKTLVIDHDHVTGITRQLLCHFCNLALGYINDDVEVLGKMAAYVTYFRGMS